MIDPRPLIDRWARDSSLTSGRLPRVEADFLLAVLECDAVEHEASTFATRRFARACADVATAVAFLLQLRNIVGPSALAAAIDAQIVELVAHELAEAQRSAHTDPLTGLGNRRSLDEDLQSSIAQAERTGRDFSLVYFDLIGLKSVNDHRGHHAGDETLRAFATALRGSARASDHTYRVGGDEFVALMPETDPDNVTALIDRIVENGAPPFSWGSTNTRADGLDPERLLRVADLRMLSSRYRLAARDVAPRPTDDEAVEPEVDLRSDARSGIRTHDRS